MRYYRHFCFTGMEKFYLFDMRVAVSSSNLGSTGSSEPSKRYKRRLKVGVMISSVISPYFDPLRLL